ncbi:MAG: GNAT family N-acetyltransferase [Pseudolysinimonas sp.]
MTPEFTIDEMRIPRSLADDREGMFAGMMAVRNAVEVAAYGIPEVAVTADEMFPHYLDEHEPKRVLLARLDGAIVGRAVHERQLGDTAVGWVDVQVLPSFQGRGIGRALTDAVEAIAHEFGQTRLITYAVSADAPGERLVAPTGFGGVPANNREVRFLLTRGWTLEQVERGSRFALPADPAQLAELRFAAEAHSGDYRVLSWAGATPPELLDDLAMLQTRMSTDAPSAGLGEPLDVWSAERFANKEALLLEAPAQLYTAAALHEPSGRLAGFTRLHAPHELSRPVGQWDTIVLSEHRGHRLGMLLKVANLELLAQDAPGHPSVLTWNAEENRPMLAVNEAVGFVPIGYEGAWGKTL